MDISSLTPGEKRVLAQLRKGRSNAEIAQVLAIATYTVQVHCNRLLKKLGVHTRQAAVQLTADCDLAEPSFGTCADCHAPIEIDRGRGRVRRYCETCASTHSKSSARKWQIKLIARRAAKGST